MSPLGRFRRPLGQDFTSEIEHYVILKLQLANFRKKPSPLPPCMTFVSGKLPLLLRRAERRLLRFYFDGWERPYEGLLPGWQPDSGTFLLQGRSLVAGGYTCRSNEFDTDPKWGQIHYAFIHPESRGKGLYRNLFCELVNRAKSWGLDGVYLNSDRHLLPEVYLRWGAEPWKRIPKVGG